MFCPNCGNKNEDSSAFCAWCGTPLKNFAPQTPPVQQPMQPIQPVQQPVQQPMQPPVQPVQQPVQPVQPVPAPQPEPEPVHPEPQPAETSDNSNNSEPAQEPAEQPAAEPEQQPLYYADDEDEEETSSKGKIIGIILGAIVLLGGIAFLGHKMEWWELPFLSSNEKSTEEAPEELDFENISGTSDSFKYDIAWPVAGDADVRNELRSWIVKQVLGTSYSEDQDFPELMSSYKQEYLNSCDADATRTINVTSEKNTPFEGYITLTYYDEEISGMSMPVANGKADELYIRLSDNKILYSEDLDAKKAITDASKMKRLVKKYGEGIDANASALPVDKMPLHLTKEGLEVGYAEGYAMRSTFIQTCTIPYVDAIPALSDEVKSFLPETLVAEADAAAQADAAAMEGLTEDLMRSLITKANVWNPDAFSSGLKALVVKNKSLYGQHYDNSDWYFTIFHFPWNDTERCMVTNPEVKIMEYYPENGRKIVRAVFDVRDRDIETGWFSQGNFEPTLFAADFIKENGKWVVDDIHTQADPYGHPIQAFDLQKSRSFKKEVKSDIDIYDSIDWTEQEDWDV